MNTMQRFYESLSRLQTNYLKALAAVTRLDLHQASALRSELGWQSWGEQNQKTATREA